MSAVLSHAPGIILLPRSRGGLRRRLAGLVGGLLPWGGAAGYRPERHYMRGGTTPGSRSLTAARARIAGQR